MGCLVRVVAGFVMGAALSGAGLAHAQIEGAGQPPRVEKEDTRKLVTVTVNPLGLAIQR